MVGLARDVVVGLARDVVVGLARDAVVGLARDAECEEFMAALRQLARLQEGGGGGGSGGKGGIGGQGGTPSSGAPRCQPLCVALSAERSLAIGRWRPWEARSLAIKARTPVESFQSAGTRLTRNLVCGHDLGSGHALQ